MKKNLIIFFAIISLFSCKRNSTFTLSNEVLLDSLQKFLLPQKKEHLRFIAGYKGFDKNLGNDVRVVFTQTAFLKRNGEVYKGMVDFTYSISKKPRNYFNENFDSLNLASIWAELNIDVFDNKGNPLQLNPSSCAMVFHPKLNLFIRHIKDTLNQKILYPIVLQPKFKPIKFINNDTIIPDILIHIDSIDELEKQKHIKQKYKGHNLTKNEIIGHEMTLLNTGAYYLSDKDRMNNAQDCEIGLKVNTTKIRDFRKLKVFVFTDQPDYNYYFRLNYKSNNEFYLDKMYEMLPLKLPLNNIYTIMIYGIEDEKCYFYIDKKVKLSKSNDFNLNIKEVSFDKLLNEIKKVQKSLN